MNATNPVLFVADVLEAHHGRQERVSDEEMHRQLELLPTSQKQAIAQAIEAFQLTAE